MGIIRLFQRRFEEAIAEGHKSVDLDPNIGENLVILAQTLMYAGNPEEAAALVQRAMRLSPFHPDHYIGILANCRRMLGRYEEAIELDTERLKRNPDNFHSDFRLAALYMELDREQEARNQAAIAVAKHPKISLQLIQFSEPYQDEDYLDRYLDRLRKAGLPE